LQPDSIANPENNWRVIPEIAGGGYFHDLASHQLDYLDFLLGPITEAKGITGNQSGIYPADDIVTASFRFESGVIGTGMWCFTTDTVSEKDSTRIVGSKGELTFNTFGSPMMIRVSDTDNEGEEFSFTHSQPIQKPLIQTIVDELRGIGVSSCTGVSGARTSLVMDMIAGKNN